MNLFQSYWHRAFFVELLILALAAPALYLSNRFGEMYLYLAFGLLGTGWIWRRVQEGVWYQPTPADWSLLFLFLVMLPVSIWVAPESLRTQYSLPRACVLLWNFQLFAVIVTYASRHRSVLAVALVLFMGIALLIALVAPFGTNWLFKLPGTEEILSRLPAVLRGLSREGGSGFHPNIIAGALLSVLPLMVSIAVAGWRRGRRDLWQRLLIGVTLYMSVVFLLLQSRSGYIGLGAALVVMLAIHYRWGRRLLALGIGAALLLLASRGNELLLLLADNPGLGAVGGVATLTNFRADLWMATVRMIYDFPFTGVGLGTFQEAISLLYPIAIPHDFYFGHAHNFWLQGAVDFGIPGLIAILALYMVAAAQLYRSRHNRAGQSIAGLATGLFGSLVAQSIFSFTDSLSMGTTANLLFWFLFALILALGNIDQHTQM